MRKRDLELLEMRFEPLQAARDRHDASIMAQSRHAIELTNRVKDLERNEEIHKTEIAQGLASIRSLLQRANRAAREQGIVEDDEVVAESLPEVDVVRSAGQVLADARAKSPGRNVL